jgi:hypothetical protein
MATPAWKALSMGARMLYVVLKGQSSNANNLAYLSYRDAANELGINRKHLRVKNPAEISQFLNGLSLAMTA